MTILRNLPHLALFILGVIVLAVIGLAILPVGTLEHTLLARGAGITITILMLVAVLGVKGDLKAAWVLFWLYLANTVAGDVITSYQTLTYGSASFPGPADAFYLSCYVFAFFGLMLLSRRAVPGRGFDATLDTLIFGLAIFAPVYVLIIAPLIVDSNASRAAIVISTAYPILDILLLSALLRIFLSLRRPSPALIVLSIAMFAFAVLDLIINYNYINGGDINVDIPWLLALSFTALAASLTKAQDLVQPDEGFTRGISAWRGLLIALAVLLIPVLAAIEQIWGDVKRSVAITPLGIVILVLLLWRAYRLLRTINAQQELLLSLAQSEVKARVEADAAKDTAEARLGELSLLNDELEKERQRFVTLFSNSPNALLVIRNDPPTILDCSDAAAVMLGASRDQIIGKSPTEFEPEYQPDGTRTLDLISRLLDQAAVVGRGSSDILRKRADGALIWTAGAVSRIEYDEQPSSLWVWWDISDRRRLEAEVREARDSAVAANLAKSQFLAMMSHEIRTPINAIINVSYLLERRQRDESDASDYATITTAANSLLSLVNDVLDLSKIEAGELALEIKSFSLREVMRDVVALFGSQALQKGITLLAPDDWTDIPHYVRGDSNRLRQMLYNLVSNAIKFTELGEVRIEAKEISTTPAAEKCRMRFTIRDTGIGIEPDKIARLFKPFSQGDLSTTRQYGGTGLGLSLVKRLAELMGGSVGVESVLGKGSVFWFEAEFGRDGGEREVTSKAAANAPPLRICSIGAKVVDSGPLEAVCNVLGWRYVALSKDEDIRRAIDGLKTGGSMDCLIVGDDNHGAYLEKAAASGVLIVRLREIEGRESPEQVFDLLNSRFIADGQGMSFLFARSQIGRGQLPWLGGATILVVDDSETNLMVLERILDGWGARVMTTSSGANAVELVRSNVESIDLVLMDLQMPELDGCGATVLIRGVSGAERIPILALTAGATTTERDRAISAGMDGFLTKPLQPQLLVGLVRQYVEGYRGIPLRLSSTV